MEVVDRQRRAGGPQKPPNPRIKFMATRCLHKLSPCFLLPHSVDTCNHCPSKSKMREGVQVLHDPFELVQPADHWFGNVLLLPPPPLDACYGGANEPSSSEHDQLLVAALQTEVFSHAHFVEHPPRKAARTSYTGGVRGDEQGLRAIALLLDCAVAISTENLAEAHRMLHELAHLASPYSTSRAERVVAYFAKAMASRIINSWTGIWSPLPRHRSVFSAFETLSAVVPFVKFAHFTANQAILEAVRQSDRIHLVDLDIMSGLQWPPLLHLLASTAPVSVPPRVRLTAFGASATLLDTTGRRLAAFATRLGVPFEFHPVASRPGDAGRTAVERRKGEVVAVSWLQHALYDGTGSNEGAARLVQALRPRVVTLVEQEATHGGGGPFLDRFVAALHYYSAVFDAMGESVGIADLDRHEVERGVLGREIDNVVAVGGPARSGDERFGSWRSEMTRRGFEQVAMSRHVVAQARLVLNLFPRAAGYNIGHADGTVKLGWKDTELYTASAWTAE